jgi:excisionase family DNA binding protein
MLSVKEAAERAEVSAPTIYEWIERGLKTNPVYYGTRKVIKILEADLDEYLSENRK